MKTKNSIRLLAVAVLASTLLLGACGNKKEGIHHHVEGLVTIDEIFGRIESVIEEL